MAQKQIGKLSVVLGANAGPFSAALKQTEKESKGWTEKQAAEEQKRLKQQEASAKKTADVRSKWLAAGAVGAGAALFGAGVAGAVSGMSDLIKVEQQARMAGVSIGEFRGAMLAAGPAAAAMEGALTSLSAGLGGLEAGLDDVATRGLKKLNLDGTADMQAVAAALGKIESPAQRAATAYEILGDSAKGVMHLLNDGGAQLGKGKDLAERFGLGADGKSVQAIKDAKMNLEAFSSGITNQLALGAAPIVLELSSHFTDLAGTVKSGAKVIAYAGATIVEAWKGVTLIWDVLKIGFKGLTGYLIQGVAWIADKINWLSGQIEELTGVTLGRFDVDSLRGASDSWLEAASQDNAKFWDKWANDKSAFQKVDEFFSRVEQRSTQASAAIAKAPFVDQFSKRFVELKKEVEQNNPLQVFKTSMAEIAAFDKQGLFKGNEGLKALMTQKAFAGLQSGVQLPQLKQPDAALAGSREAYSAIVQFQRGDQRLTVQEQLKALQVEANKMQAEQVRIGKEVAESLQKIATAKVEGRDI